MISGTDAIRSDDTVILDADGDGLRVAETSRWRVASAASIVAVQATIGIKEQPSPKICQFETNWSPKPGGQCGFDVAGEPRPLKYGAQLPIDATVVGQ